MLASLNVATYALASHSVGRENDACAAAEGGQQRVVPPHDVGTSRCAKSAVPLRRASILPRDAVTGGRKARIACATSAVFSIFGTNRQKLPRRDLLLFVARFTTLFYLPGETRVPARNLPPRITLVPRPTTRISFPFHGASSASAGA